MQRKSLFFAAAALLSLLAMACATTVPPDMTVRDLAREYQADRVKPKVDNFLVVLDTSASMEDSDGTHVKFDTAKAFVYRMNNTLPPMDMTAGLRTLGHDLSVARQPTVLAWGMTAYERAALTEAMNKQTMPGGNTLMLQALQAAAEDIKPLSGKTALIIVSDGIGIDPRPVAVIDGLKQELGDRLCVYTVLVGNNPAGAAFMQRLAGAATCGFATTADEVAGPDRMADFVKRVFVADYVPPPPPAPAPAADPDSDGDGVPDRLDRCPGTPLGARVNAQGCWILADLNFDTNKSEIKPNMMPVLNEALAVLKQNPTLRIEVQGHTDSVGAAAYNQKLSERRADAVKNYFVQNGIAATRVSAKGYGEEQSIADNATAEGRAQNRRVQLQPIQ